MTKIRKNSFKDGIILRQVRCKVLIVACRACGRSDEMNRKAVVQRHGAAIPIRNLRRRLALGCERMNAADGIDRCQLDVAAKPETREA
ncbi:hypothetical protein [Rhizobium sp. BE258]|uniref:hypothetical protein n=1 Tax=Rhizobium sp. BE258 TaxID=2817722 RepID=UPI00286C5184|nr:hypothetical protein [Rhizobium sp. BE258]